jgi:hypothetical protein
MWQSIKNTLGIITSNDTTSTTSSNDLITLPLPPNRLTDQGICVNQRFESLQQCRTYINCFCRGEGLSQPPGYAVNIRRTLMSKNRVDYVCDRARMPRHDLNVTKRRSSKKIGCPFSLQARRAPDGYYDLFITNQYHNHQGSIDIEVHSSLRRPSDGELTENLKDLIKNAPSKQAQEAIQNATNCPITKQDIYNLKRKFDKINK